MLDMTVKNVISLGNVIWFWIPWEQWCFLGESFGRNCQRYNVNV